MRVSISLDSNGSLGFPPTRCTVKPEATFSMTEVLIPIWQRVLQLSSVRVDDDFFDLGGDSSLALQLFNEIAQVCDREIPPVTIYQARTITALAALLEQPVPPRFPSLVLLKAGAKQLPVFLAHGLGGTVMDFFQLARCIESHHPIYGMQAMGMDGLDEPLERVEDMAQFHLDAIRELQPYGPYLLVGYSAMLDAYPNIRYLSLGQQIRLATRQAKRRLHALGGAPYQPPVSASFTPAMQRVRNSAELALTRYRPRFYPGKIKFVRAEISSKFPDDAVAVWAPLADEFEVETVPGDHLGMMATHFESLASVLSRYLEEAFADSRIS